MSNRQARKARREAKRYPVETARAVFVGEGELMAVSVRYERQPGEQKQRVTVTLPDGRTKEAK